jgi:hypothetical protein
MIGLPCLHPLLLATGLADLGFGVLHQYRPSLLLHSCVSRSAHSACLGSIACYLGWGEIHVDCHCAWYTILASPCHNHRDVSKPFTGRFYGLKVQPPARGSLELLFIVSSVRSNFDTIPPCLHTFAPLHVP